MTEISNEDHQYYYNVFFESIQEGALNIDLEGKIGDVNENMLNFTGYSQAEMLHQSILDFTPDGAPSHAYDALFSLQGRDSKAVFETELILKNQETIKVEIFCHFMGEEKMGNALVVCRDLTYFAKTAKAILARNDAYRYIMDHCSEGVIIINEKGIITDASHTSTSLTGYSTQEMIGAKYSQFFLEKHPATNKDDRFEDYIFNKYLKTKTDDIIPVRTKAHQGVDLKGLDTVVLFIDRMKEYDQLIEFIRRERKFMEKILAGITNKDNVGILISGSEVGFIYANDFICKIFDYTLNELSTFSYLAHLMDDNDPEGHIETSMEVINHAKNKVEITPRFLRKDGTFFQADLKMTNHKTSSGDNITLMLFENIIDTEDKLEDIEEGKMASIAAKLSNQNKSGIILATATKGIAYANRLCSDAFGYTHKEMENLKGPSFVHAGSMAQTASKGIKVYTGFSAKENFPCRFIKKDGSEINADLTIFVHKEDGMKYLVLQLEEITQAEHLLTAE